MKVPLVFFGHNAYSALALKTLLTCPNLLVKSIITLPDKPQGRHQEIKANPVKKIALKHHLPLVVYNQKFIKNPPPQSTPVGFLASFGAIIPQTIIDLFPKGIVVLHPSLLPQYRGPTPLQTTILNLDRETGITLFLMHQKVDYGPLLAQEKITLTHKETTPELAKLLFKKGAQLADQVIPPYLTGKIKPRPQNHCQATYTHKITSQDGHLDWQKTPQKLDAQIRALNPNPGTWCQINLSGKIKRLKIIKSKIKNQQLVLEIVQLEGKKPVTWQEFEKGYPKLKLL